VARAAVTLLRADPKHFPLRSGARLGVISPEGSLAGALVARVPTAKVRVVPAYPKQALRAALRAQARELALASDVVVVGVINSRQLELVTMAAATGKPVVVVSMGVPYITDSVTEAKVVVATYSYRSSATEAAIAALFGEHGTPGKLPVALQAYPFGHGLDPVGDAHARRAAVTASGEVTPRAR
jgi:beta-N-acetylhexosaminidase